MIRLDELIACANCISMDSLMRLLSMNELLRNNPGRKNELLFSVLQDRDAWRLSRRLLMLYSGSFTRRAGARA